jgi:hypothetical protein
MFWLLVSFNRKAKKLFKLLKKYDVRCIGVEESSRPLYLKRKSFFEKIKFYILNLRKFTEILRDLIFIKFNAKFEGHKYFSIHFKTGNAVIQPDQYTKTIVPINSIDHQKYLHAKMHADRLVPEKYALYLDSFMPHHNDNDLVGKTRLNADNYYRGMNDFFSQFEKKYGCQVVIAAHPSAIYDENLFDGRLILRQSTPELSKYADVVFGDCSLSVCYGILFKKPIFLLVNNEILSLYKHDPVLITIESYAAYLSQPVINIDNFDIEDLSKYFHICDEKYTSYEETFLTTKNTKQNRNFDIIKSALLKINE